MSERETGAVAEQGQVNVVYSDGDLPNVPGLDQRMRQVAYQLESWVKTTRAITGQASLFDRGKYISSDNPYDQMMTARAAIKDDDVVASAAELTEGLAFQGVKWECDDWDTTDVFNQMAAELDLDNLVRKIWREEYTVSQAVCAFWWDEGEFTVRGQTDKGNKRKKTVKVWYPRRVTLLDPTRIVPVGMLAFGQTQLAWKATSAEMDAYAAIASGRLQDPVMERFYKGQYIVTDPEEMSQLTKLKVDVSRLLLLDDRYVTRTTTTMADYERFPTVRLKSIFRMLDLKQQLMEADRVMTIGAANYILLVKKGDKDDPAYPEEIANLKDNYHTLAKLPVIFSDHRLNIEIVAPKQDFTLNSAKYDTLDNRIVARLLNTITAPGSRDGNRSDNSLTLGRPIARAMESRRHMIRRYLEREIAKAVVEHPKNKGLFDQAPSLAYSPPNIQMDADAGTAAVLMQARTMRDLSRESFLEYFGFDQQVEAMRMELEADKYDDIFKTAVPFNSPQNNPQGEGEESASGTNPADHGGAPATQAVNGKRGGRPTGGGSPKQSPGSASRRTGNGTTSPKAGQ